MSDSESGGGAGLQALIDRAMPFVVTARPWSARFRVFGNWHVILIGWFPEASKNRLILYSLSRQEPQVWTSKYAPPPSCDDGSGSEWTPMEFGAPGRTNFELFTG
jgi:hypothetical protein